MRPREFLPRNDFGLREPVGDGRSNRPDDVATVERLLNRVGQPPFGADREATGLFSVPLRDSIRRFQRGNRLRDDGIVNPDGETLEALGAQAFDRPPGAPELDRRKRAECHAIAQRIAETAAAIAARKRKLETLRNERDQIAEAIEQQKSFLDPLVGESDLVKRLRAALREREGQIEVLNEEIELLNERNRGLEADLRECRGEEVGI